MQARKGFSRNVDLKNSGVLKLRRPPKSFMVNYSAIRGAEQIEKVLTEANQKRYRKGGLNW